jgi:S-DNA-T family DNA segregation ATPase FtsK/SpoIIIE
MTSGTDMSLADSMPGWCAGSLLGSVSPALWVRARMLAGQVAEDWGKVSDRLCQTFGAQDCRVRSVPGRPHEIEAWFLVNDPQEVIRPHEHEVPVRLDGLPIGLGEDGDVFRLPLAR